MKTKRAVLIALLPTLHLSACLIMATARVASGWMYVSNLLISLHPRSQWR